MRLRYGDYIMKIEITEKNENVLLERTDLKGTVDFEGVTPSNNEVAAAIASNLGVEQGLIVVKGIYTQFSKQNGTFNAVAYKNVAALEKTERITKHLRKKAEADAKKDEEAKAAEVENKKKADEEAAAAKEAEKSAEEVKEEAPVEEKAEEPKEEEAEEKTEEVAPAKEE